MLVRCVVAAVNADGEPDLYFVQVECTEEQYGMGLHYDAAMKSATNEGYDPKLAYDENDSAGVAMMPLFHWGTSSVVTA